jgi:hypothetical protein
VTEPLLYPKAVWRPITSHGGLLVADRGVVEHITTNHFSPYGFFSNPLNSASSHFWISDEGLVEQYIDLRMKSWAQAGGNSHWVSVEISGSTGSLKTDAQCSAFAALLAWGHLHPELKWPLDAVDSPEGMGVGWHGMGAPSWGHAFCPGAQRVAQTTDVPLSDADVAKVAQAVTDMLFPMIRNDMRTLLGNDPTKPDEDPTHYGMGDIGRDLRGKSGGGN